MTNRSDRQSAAEFLAAGYHAAMRADIERARERVRAAETELDAAKTALDVKRALLSDHMRLFRLAAGVAEHG